MAHEMLPDVATQEPARHLAWDACYNVRDTGGYPTHDGHTTRWRALLRADNLCRLSADGCAALASYGVRTIIDLRTPAEVALAPHPFGPEAAEARAHGVAYLHLSLIASHDPGVQAAIGAASGVEQSYLRIVALCRPQMGAVLSAVAQAAEGGVLVHCHAGKDRTGLVVAMLLSLAGVSPEVVADDYALSDTHLQTQYADERAAAGDEALVRQMTAGQVSPPQAMRAVLSLISTQYGGVEDYVRACGVSALEVERLRLRLRS